MKQIFKIPKLLIFLSLTVFSLLAHGQQSFTLSSHQYFKIKGTSTLHDWEMQSAKAKGKAKINLENGKITGISSLFIDLPAESLKSGKNAMDKNAHDALLADEVPEIKLELTEAKSITDQTVKAKIKLSIAGTTHFFNWDVDYFLSDESILFSSSQKLKFSDFQITPPKAMLGAINTGNDLILSFETIFELTN